MIILFGQSFAWNAPEVLIPAVILLLVLGLLVMVLRASGRRTALYTSPHLEAFAERLHERVRREFWGYAPHEALDNAGLIHEKYQGIRPAPGYPACPDHREKGTLFAVAEAEVRAGIVLTESYAMMPGASVSGWYFWRPESTYFGVGKLLPDQLNEYAERAGRVADGARCTSTLVAG